MLKLRKLNVGFRESRTGVSDFEVFDDVELAGEPLDPSSDGKPSRRRWWPPRKRQRTLRALQRDMFLEQPNKDGPGVGERTFVAFLHGAVHSSHRLKEGLFPRRFVAFFQDTQNWSLLRDT